MCNRRLYRVLGRPHRTLSAPASRRTRSSTAVRRCSRRCTRIRRACASVPVGDDRHQPRREHGDRARSFRGRTTRRSSTPGRRRATSPCRWRSQHPHLRGIGLRPARRSSRSSKRTRRGRASRDRLTFAEATSSPIRCRQADVVMMGHILHDWDLAQKKLLIAQSLRRAAGRRRVHRLRSRSSTTTGRQNAFGLLMSLNMLIETPGGFDYTGADCIGWMKEAGLPGRPTSSTSSDPDSMVVGIRMRMSCTLSPRHRHGRRRAGRSRLLPGRARAPPRQEDGQLRQPSRLPLLLRRRARHARHHLDDVPVRGPRRARSGPKGAGPGDGDVVLGARPDRCRDVARAARRARHRGHRRRAALRRPVIRFADRSGSHFELIATGRDARTPWSRRRASTPVDAIRGLHSVTTRRARRRRRRSS